MRFFTSKELEKATDHYNENRILDQGGEGTVYKGMLADGRIVAIKKSKRLADDKKNQSLDEKHVEQWVNEESSLFDILDRHVVNDGPNEEIIAVAELAKRCLNLNGKRRPTMKQVAMELEWIRAPEGDNSIRQISDVEEDFEDDGTEPWNNTASCSM
ncbi:hypothetical protein COLO4_33861 [Corchorus olitorius]|uniref:Protein kinase domain-containing protein n=1 Tax=Corchorus olitorius TaxID=93759 RepID=A0A1R3GQI6_9ROSI|nr:hypothetical protein COLO4_33861 [Corchorus olitorius]